MILNAERIHIPEFLYHKKGLVLFIYSFHVVAFIKIKDKKIPAIDEYWGDAGEASQWRQDK